MQEFHLWRQVWDNLLLMLRPDRQLRTALLTRPSSPPGPPWVSIGGVLLLMALVIGVAPGAQANSKRPKAQAKIKMVQKLPEKPTAIPVTRGKVAVFAFKGDYGDSVRAEVVHVLRARGLDVMTSLRPVDSASQFREMADTLDLAAYVEGDVRDDGKKETAIVRVRSGATGLRVASVTFSGDERKISAEVGRTMWSRVGIAVARACAVAARPRKHERAPMRIEAGTPIETTPAVEAREGT